MTEADFHLISNGASGDDVDHLTQMMSLTKIDDDIYTVVTHKTYDMVKGATSGQTERTTGDAAIELSLNPCEEATYMVLDGWEEEPK